MNIEYLKNKKIIVAGYGKSGKAVKRFFDRHGIECSVTDGSLEGDDILNPAFCFNENYDLAVISPSIERSTLKNAFPGAEKITEVCLANRINKRGAICVTGTNGKTTVVKLIEHVLKEAGKNALAVGNVGEPYIDHAEEDFLPICELSSFMLDKIQDFYVSAGMILNVSPDHLAYHKTFENYLSCKLKLVDLCRASSLLSGKNVPIIVNENLKKYTSKLNVLYFSLKNQTEGIYLGGSDRILRLKGEETVFPFFERPAFLAEENVLPVILLCKLLGLEDQAIINGVKSFKSPPFRIQKSKSICGINVFNDSKGTNPDSTLFALKTLPGQKYLIIGGYDKGLDMEDFFKTIPRLGVEKVFLCGANEGKLFSACKKVGYSNAIRCKDLESSLKNALEEARRSGVKTILFSPATSSFDRFKDFEERGRYFEKLVEEYRS